MQYPRTPKTQSRTDQCKREYDLACGFLSTKPAAKFELRIQKHEGTGNSELKLAEAAVVLRVTKDIYEDVPNGPTQEDDHRQSSPAEEESKEFDCLKGWQSLSKQRKLCK